jgi:creatinine amidohydrolase
LCYDYGRIEELLVEPAARRRTTGAACWKEVVVTDHVQYLELTPAEFRARLAEAPVAYLPLGTLEWHGEHLPLGADALQAHGFFLRLARAAGGIVLPPLFLGPDRVKNVRGEKLIGMDHFGAPEGTEGKRDGSAYWVPDRFFAAILESVLTQLARAGFLIVVAHGHGPSTECFRAISARWERRLGLRLIGCWRDEEAEKDGLGLMTDHAAANETSITMALHPDLVHMEHLPADPAVRLVGVAGLDPRTHANADVGHQILRLQEDRMVWILREELRKLRKRAKG